MGTDQKYYRWPLLTHLTLKMTSTQVVMTSVTNNTSLQNFPHQDKHIIATIDELKLSYFQVYVNVRGVSRSQKGLMTVSMIQN